jgi:hypothetical protein
MSIAFDLFVLFVSFVVKQFCTSARGTSFFCTATRILTLDPFSGSLSF